MIATRARGEAFYTDDEATPPPSPEKTLWLSVLLLGAQDAKSQNANLRRDVELWLSTQDFEVVCAYADQDVETTRRGFKRILSTSHTPNAQRPEETAEEYAARMQRNVAARSYYNSRKQEKMLSTQCH